MKTMKKLFCVRVAFTNDGFFAENHCRLPYKFVPYVVWGHRDVSPMAVWMKKK